MDPRLLSPVQTDALCEVTHIGCGAAATALSQLLGGRRVGLEVTRAGVPSDSELVTLLDRAGTSLAAIHLRVRGEIEGHTMLAFGEPGARAVASLLVGRDVPRWEGPFAALARSALMEAGNIVASAMLSGIGRITGLMLLPSVPTLAFGPPRTLLESSSAAISDERPALALETRIWIENASDGSVDAQLVVRPHRRAIPRLLAALDLD